MKTAKLLAFEPMKNEDGSHKTYEGRYGTMWKFTTTFDSGDKGETSSTKEFPNWKIDVEYNIEIIKRNSFTNIRIHGKKNSDFSSSGGNHGKTVKLPDHVRMFRAAQVVSLALVKAKQSIFKSKMSYDERAEKVDAVMHLVKKVVAIGLANEKLQKSVYEAEIWDLTVNSVLTLIENGEEITEENLRAENRIAVRYVIDFEKKNKTE
jgi:hypothetical protein